ncbi:MAG: DNRLRE domain-containing protein [Melioribacteraceae bacterium]|nr:DNRLRE domain-containing protein [Melioribacteraceae bacterium]
MKKKILLLLFPVVLFFYSCSDSPTSVGENLIPNDDKITFNEFDTFKEDTPQNSYSYVENIKLGSSDRIILGKTSYGESYILLLFRPTLIDTLVTRLKNNQLKISDTWVSMKPNYFLGDKNLPFNFTVHQIRNKWGIIGFDRDSLKNLQYDQNNISTNIKITDTLITFKLPLNVVESWLRYTYDSTLTKNYGIILKPTSNTQRMIGFKAVYSSEEISTSVVLNYAIERTPIPVFKDTLNVSPFLDNHVVSGKLTKLNNLFYLQSSYALRAILSFDLSKLPTNIIVNKATLELTKDDKNSFDGSPSSDSIDVQILADSVSKKLTSDSLYNITLSKQSNSNIYSGDLTWMVQKWLKGEINQGLKLSLTDEYSATSLIAFYNSKETNKALRPRLKIIYAKK